MNWFTDPWEWFSWRYRCITEAARHDPEVAEAKAIAERYVSNPMELYHGWDLSDDALDQIEHHNPDVPQEFLAALRVLKAVPHIETVDDGDLDS